MNNVVDNVVSKGKCCGCGICAGMARKCNLSMMFNIDGELNPSVSDCNECKLCLLVCPFSGSMENNLNEMPLGKSLVNYVGYSKVGTERAQASSGGMATRVLKALLEMKMVDGVVVVKSSTTKNRLFEASIVRKSEDINPCAGSKYYPVEFSGIIKQMQHENGTFAIIGLPCIVNGFRKVQRHMSETGNKIKYILGLTCGHNKNSNYTKMLLKYLKVNEADISTVYFRHKENSKRASNFGFVGKYRNGGATRILNFQDSIIKQLWCNYYFSMKSCFYCKDVFAEKADISFMDAWLKPYSDDPLGTSLVIVRNDDIESLLQNEKENICVKVISSEEVIKSQEGVVDNKNGGLLTKRSFIFNHWFSNRVFSRKENKNIGLLLVLSLIKCDKIRSRSLYIYSQIKIKLYSLTKEIHERMSVWIKI